MCTGARGIKRSEMDVGREGRDVSEGCFGVMKCLINESVAALKSSCNCGKIFHHRALTKLCVDCNVRTFNKNLFSDLLAVHYLSS